MSTVSLRLATDGESTQSTNFGTSSGPSLVANVKDVRMTYITNRVHELTNSKPIFNCQPFKACPEVINKIDSKGPYVTMITCKMSEIVTMETTPTTGQFLKQTTCLARPDRPRS
jgi:hypothetical protein